jgi:hypothetical protein
MNTAVTYKCYDVNKHAACNVNDSVTVAKSCMAMALADSLINALFLVCSDLATILDVLLEYFFFPFISTLLKEEFPKPSRV